MTSDGDVTVAAEADPTGPHPVELGRAELRGDLPAGWTVLGLALLGGLAVGAVWALVAAGLPVVLLGARTAPLTDQGNRVFDATALFVLLVVAFGVLVGGLAWRWRTRRGPVVLAGAVLGALAGAWLAARTGTWWASGSAPVPTLLERARASADGLPGPPVPALRTTQPPVLGSWWAILTGGLGAALGYVVPAIVLGEEDLDRA